MGDETRNLIDSAQSLIDKDGRPQKMGKDDSTAARLITEAGALSSKKARRDGPSPSTRQLVVEAERLVGGKKGASDAKKGGNSMMIIMAVAFLLGGIAVWFLLRS